MKGSYHLASHPFTQRTQRLELVLVMLLTVIWNLEHPQSLNLPTLRKWFLQKHTIRIGILDPLELGWRSLKVKTELAHKVMDTSGATENWHSASWSSSKETIQMRKSRIIGPYQKSKVTKEGAQMHQSTLKIQETTQTSIKICLLQIEHPQLKARATQDAMQAHVPLLTPTNPVTTLVAASLAKSIDTRSLRGSLSSKKLNWRQLRRGTKKEKLPKPYQYRLRPPKIIWAHQKTNHLREIFRIVRKTTWLNLI